MGELPESVVNMAMEFVAHNGAVKETGATPTMGVVDFVRHVDTTVGLVTSPEDQIEDVGGMAAWCVVNAELLLAEPDELRKLENRLITLHDKTPHHETSTLLSMVSLMRKLGATD